MKTNITQISLKDQKIVKILAMSDSHDRHNKLDPSTFPQADIFIHAGDFTRCSRKKQFQKFRKFIESVKCKYKIVIAGNHDFGLDPKTYQQNIKLKPPKPQEEVNPLEEIKKMKEVCIYLEHEVVEIEGIRIFGSPYTPFFYAMAFNYQKEDAEILWSAIPEKIDILITHGPCFGILDKTKKAESVGCKILREKILQISPKLHIFGHIHESFGVEKHQKTKFYNVACVDVDYQIKNQPVLIELFHEEQKI